MSDFFHCRRQFVELVDDLHRHLGLAPKNVPDADDEALALPIRHRGVAMALVHDGSSWPECCAIECHLDAISSTDGEMARELLSLNFHCLSEGIGTIALSESQDAVLFTRPVLLERATAEGLLGELNTTAQVHGWWHETEEHVHAVA
jgi:hypothetical protein